VAEFGRASQLNLATCHEDIQQVLQAAILVIDFSVLCGHRGEAAQHEAFVTGNSDIEWPAGNHNSLPSKAVDIAPYPIKWEDTHRFAFLAGIIMETARARGIKMRWGGDWDGDTETIDQSLADFGHFELSY